MVDSTVVLWGQTLAYTLYCIAMILVVGWVVRRLTKPARSCAGRSTGAASIASI